MKIRVGGPRHASQAGTPRSHLGPLQRDFLERKSLAHYHRGVIRILDAKNLEKRACECYHAIKDYLDSYSDFDSTFIS
jgi:hypothetical protein